MKTLQAFDPELKNYVGEMPINGRDFVRYDPGPVFFFNTNTVMRYQVKFKLPIGCFNGMPILINPFNQIMGSLAIRRSWPYADPLDLRDPSLDRPPRPH